MVDDLESLAEDEAVEPHRATFVMDVGERMSEAVSEVQHAAAAKGAAVVCRVESAACQELCLNLQPEYGLVRVRVELPLAGIPQRDAEALLDFTPEAEAPDLVRGIAGPFGVALRALRRGGARFEINTSAAGLHWECVLPQAELPKA